MKLHVLGFDSWDLIWSDPELIFKEKNVLLPTGAEINSRYDFSFVILAQFWNIGLNKKLLL